MDASGEIWENRVCFFVVETSSGAVWPMNDTVTEPRLKARSKTKRPRLYKVILVNDDFTPKEFVVMVLQAEYFEDEDKEWWYKESGTPKEVERYVSDYEGAIDYLDAKGLLDRNRVGIVGFSRTCLYVKYALTHSKYHFAAASINDGIDGGYFQYIAFNASANAPVEFEGFNGGIPFGQGLESWTKRSPGFNLDKVQTPVRITAENLEVILSEWEWFAGLRRLGKPVEMIAIQDGLHELQRPWERMISLQGNVDWFTFWLKGEEDPDPSKAEQYARWRRMR